MVSNKAVYSSTEKAILTTLLYSDIFDFPLTSQEIWRFLISEKKIAKKIFSDALRGLFVAIVCKDGYYFLRGREAIVNRRQQNIAEVQKKLESAKRAVYYLSYIPTIRFIGISGGLAMHNVTKDDDIDLFLIVKKGTLFVTRFWILCLLEWKGLRRKRKDTNPADKICVNLLIDEGKLAWSTKKRDLYTAHEIAQLIPLFQRDDTYQKFVESNTWIRKFLPNSQDERSIFLGRQGKRDYRILRYIGGFLFSHFFERCMYEAQKYYMKKHQTTEVIAKGILAFHPKDYRIKTLTILNSKCDKLGLLTNL